MKPIIDILGHSLVVQPIPFVRGNLHEPLPGLVRIAPNPPVVKCPSSLYAASRVPRAPAVLSYRE